MTVDSPADLDAVTRAYDDALPAGEAGDFTLDGTDRTGVHIVAADFADPGGTWPRSGSFGYGFPPPGPGWPPTRSSSRRCCSPGTCATCPAPGTRTAPCAPGTAGTGWSTRWR